MSSLRDWGGLGIAVISARGFGRLTAAFAGQIGQGCGGGAGTPAGSSLNSVRSGPKGTLVVLAPEIDRHADQSRQGQRKHSVRCLSHQCDRHHTAESPAGIAPRTLECIMPVAVTAALCHTLAVHLSMPEVLLSCEYSSPL